MATPAEHPVALRLTRTSYLYAHGIRVFDYPRFAEAQRERIRAPAQECSAPRWVARGKPAADLFLDAAAMMAVPPANCVVIEDSVAGVHAAIASAAACRCASSTIVWPARGTTAVSARQRAAVKPKDRGRKHRVRLAADNEDRQCGQPAAEAHRRQDQGRKYSPQQAAVA